MGIAKAHYTAPDQASARARPDPTSDVYSIAAVLYRALAGEPPPEGVERVLGGDPYRPLAGLGLPGCPPGIAAAVDAGLRVRKDDRPQSIAELRRRLGWMRAAPARPSLSAPSAPTLVETGPAPSPAPIPAALMSAAKSVAKTPPARRLPLVLGAAVALAAAGMGAMAVHGGRSAPAPVAEASGPTPPSRPAAMGGRRACRRKWPRSRPPPRPPGTARAGRPPRAHPSR